jgi:hypothetical protein
LGERREERERERERKKERKKKEKEKEILPVQNRARAMLWMKIDANHKR